MSTLERVRRPECVDGAEWVLGNYMWKDFANQINTYFAQGLYATGIATCRLAV